MAVRDSQIVEEWVGTGGEGGLDSKPDSMRQRRVGQRSARFV